MSTASDVDVNLDEALPFAIQLAKDAGAILLSALDRRREHDASESDVEKVNAVDIVTQTDHGSQ